VLDVKWYQQLKMFLEEVWIEIRPKEGKVSWPTKDEIMESTMVVFLCVAVFGVFLGLLDVLFRNGMKLLVGR
jgi:preprotein translocase SecE subunit